MPTSPTATSTHVQTTVGYAGSIRESLDSILGRLGQEATPFLTSLPQEGGGGTRVDWISDEYRSPVTHRHVEASRTETENRAVPKRLHNYMSIIKDSIEMSGSMQAANVATGASREMRRLELKVGMELKRDLDMMLMSWQSKRSGINDATAASGSVDDGEYRMFGSLPFWIPSSNIQSVGSQNDNSLGTGHANPSFAGRTDLVDLTEENLNKACQKVWEHGGVPNSIFVSANTLYKIQSFPGAGGTSVARQTTPSQSRTIRYDISIVITPWGQATVTPCPNMPVFSGTAPKSCNYVFVGDKRFNKLSVYRKWQTEPLGKEGDSDRVQILSEVSFKAMNPSTNALIMDLKD